MTDSTDVRLFHFSDTHLGHQQYGRTAPSGINQREQDIYDAFDAVIDHAVEERPDLVIHAGDLFDGVRPSNRALGHALDGFLRLSRAGIPTVIIAGNHEHPRLRETGSPFRLLEHLENVHPVYRGKRETITTGGVHVHAVPQCPSAEALSAEVAAIEPDPGRNILVLHGAVQSVKAFGNAEFNELTLESHWFDGRFDYVALGHFHGVQEITPRAWYCGAPERVSMAEAGEEKGFLDVSIGDAVQVEVRSLPGRIYVDLPRIDAGDLDGATVEALATESLQRVPEGAVCRLRIDNLDPTLRGTLPVKEMQQQAAHALHLDLRLDWRDTSRSVRGQAEIGSLLDEFDAFMQHHPVEGLDRKRLTGMARRLLQPELQEDLEAEEPAVEVKA